MNVAARLLFAVVTGLLVVTSPVVPAQDQGGRIAARVVDAEGRALGDVLVTVTVPSAAGSETVYTTDRKGRVTIELSDTTRTYEVRLEKPGYETARGPVQGVAGQTVKVTWALTPGGDTDERPDGGDSGGGSLAIRAFNEGVEAQKLGDLDLAESKYREASALDPELAIAHTALAAVASIREDWATAAAEAEAALAVDPGDFRALQLRFDAYRLGGDEARAEEAARALSEAGGLDDAVARIFNEGVAAFNAGDPGEAVTKFRQVIDLDPGNARAYLALSQVSLNGGAPAESFAMAEKALALEPDNTSALKIAFDAARLSGDSEAAGEALDRLVVLEPKWVATTVFDHASELFNSDQPEAAAFELRYVIKADPDLARARLMLGMALFNTGREDEGRPHLERFIELAPDDPDAEIARGLLSFEQ